jgi:hypothetical protein
LLLQQDVEFGAMFVNRPPKQVRLTAQRRQHFVEMPGSTCLASGRFYAVSFLNTSQS